jgi:glutamyl-Q tRNA(Asp) synthetase
MASEILITRFAPSPTGPMHAGNAYSALCVWQAAREAGGRFLLRIEDIDRARCRPEFEAALYEDLAWLGLAWEQPVRRQSEHMDDYAAALDRLDGMGVTYPCFCTRGTIRAEIERSPSAPHGPDGPLYPGICRDLPADERAARVAAGEPHAIRLDAAKAAEIVGPGLTWHDRRRGIQALEPLLHGDVVLARKDIPASYHLAVTVDDALQGITLVCRGEDLFQSTHVHRLLQALFGLPTPDYDHHGLIRDDMGIRMAKRHGAPSLRDLRQSGITAAEFRRRLGFGW